MIGFIFRFGFGDGPAGGSAFLAGTRRSVVTGLVESQLEIVEPFLEVFLLDDLAGTLFRLVGSLHGDQQMSSSLFQGGLLPPAVVADHRLGWPEYGTAASAVHLRCRHARAERLHQTAILWNESNGQHQHQSIHNRFQLLNSWILRATEKDWKQMIMIMKQSLEVEIECWLTVGWRWSCWSW